MPGPISKQRLMKARLMPVKCPSEEEDKCTVDLIEHTEGDHIHEVDENKYEAAKKEMEREKRFKKQEFIKSITLMASFNYWLPVEMKMRPHEEGEGEGEGEGEKVHDPVEDVYSFCDYLPPGKHYFYFIKNKKYFTLCKRYKIGRFKECKNVWLNYVEVEQDFSKVELLYEKQKRKEVERQDDIRDFFLYRNWKTDDEVILKKMFETDWGYTKIFRVIKNNEKELYKVKKVLWKNYSKIKELFTSESGLSSYP
jgi:hypothetical protein